MTFTESLERFTQYCKWQEEGKKPHIEASKAYGLSIWDYFDELVEMQNLVYNKVFDELVEMVAADGFDIEGLRRLKEDNDAA